MRPEIPRLMIISAPPSEPPEGPGQHEFLDHIGRALEGAGADAPRVAIQLRAKGTGLSGRAQHQVAVALRDLTGRVGATLLIHGRVDVALAVGADGVHLPEDGLSPVDARRLLGDAALVGVSRHDAAGLLLASQEGADFATLSPFAASPGKGPPLGDEGFAAALRHTSLPVLALGGVDPATAAQARTAGAAGVAVIRAVHTAADPGDAVRRLLAALDTPGGGR
jgi:thiamine-phosphate pyrophosphorylase